MGLCGFFRADAGFLTVDTGSVEAALPIRGVLVLAWLTPMDGFEVAGTLAIRDNFRFEGLIGRVAGEGVSGEFKSPASSLTDRPEPDCVDSSDFLRLENYFSL